MRFRRRDRAEDAFGEESDDALDEEFDEESADEFDESEWPDDELVEPAPSATAAQTTGPYDVADAPVEDGPTVDLGGLRLRVFPGVELRVDMHEQTPVAATYVDGQSALQVSAFAAPKSSGLWAEVRTELAASLRSGGGAQTVPGPFGTELRGRAPVTDQRGQAAGSQPIRFIGVDGPRWFLRGVLTGPAATDDSRARRLLDAFRSVVVVRGGEAMAPRDQIPLHLPREMLPPEPPAAASGPDLDPFRRGPEITETR
jgi:hypothetical protein